MLTANWWMNLYSTVHNVKLTNQDFTKPHVHSFSTKALIFVRKMFGSKQVLQALEF